MNRRGRKATNCAEVYFPRFYGRQAPKLVEAMDKMRQQAEMVDDDKPYVPRHPVSKRLAGDDLFTSRVHTPIVSNVERTYNSISPTDDDNDNDTSFLSCQTGGDDVLKDIAAESKEENDHSYIVESKEQDHQLSSVESKEQDHQLSSASYLPFVAASLKDTLTSDRESYDITGTSVFQSQIWLKGAILSPIPTCEDVFRAMNYESNQSDSSPDIKLIRHSDAKRRVISIDDDTTTPVLLYSTNQAISFRKASLIFESKTDYADCSGAPSALFCKGVYKKATESFEKFSARFWSSSINDTNQRSLEFVKALFNFNVNVKELLGNDFEDKFLIPSNKDGQVPVYPENSHGKSTQGDNRSLRALVEARDMRGLLDGKWASTQIQDTAGQICAKLREELFGLGGDTFLLPPEMYSLHMVNYEIIRPKKDDPISKRLKIPSATMQVLDYELVFPNAYSNGKILIPPDVRYLVGAFMKPDWTGTGEKHAAFIKVDLKMKSMLAYDSLHLPMRDCIIATQNFIHQYSMRNSLVHYSSSPADEVAAVSSSIPQWTVYDISKKSLEQHNGLDCTLWSIWMLFCHFLDIPASVFLTPQYDIKHCRGAAWGWSGCGLINNDVSSMLNADAWGTQHTFMNRWRLIVAYLLSHLVGGEDKLGVPSVDKIVADFQNAKLDSNVEESSDSSKQLFSCKTYSYGLQQGDSGCGGSIECCKEAGGSSKGRGAEGSCDCRAEGRGNGQAAGSGEVRAEGGRNCECPSTLRIKDEERIEGRSEGSSEGRAAEEEGGKSEDGGRRRSEGYDEGEKGIKVRLWIQGGQSVRPARLFILSPSKTIYIAHSQLTVRNTFPKQGVGRGLFAYVQFRPGDRICYFSPGDIISQEEADRRDLNQCGGYMIQFAENVIQDIYYYRDFCFASMANSPKNLVNVNGRLVSSNARLVIDAVNRRASLKATKPIHPFSEILWSYGSRYVFPHF